MAVFFAFPVFMAPVIVLRGILLFRRDIVRDKEVKSIKPQQHVARPSSLACACCGWRCSVEGAARRRL